MLKEKLRSFCGAIKKDGQPLVFAALSSWLLTLSAFTIISPIAYTKVPEYADSIPTAIFLLIVFVAFAALYCINKFLLKKSLFLIMPLSFLLYGITSVSLSANNAATRAFSAFIFSAFAIIILVLCINYAKNQKIPLLTKDISFGASLAIFPSW